MKIQMSIPRDNTVLLNMNVSVKCMRKILNLYYFGFDVIYLPPTLLPPLYVQHRLGKPGGRREGWRSAGIWQHK